jgi:phage terminase small subunit
MAKKTSGDALSVKQETFALAYVETGNASEAYRRAFTVGETTKPETVWTEASKTLANPKVALRVMELQELASLRTLVSIESLTGELEEARILAMQSENGASAAVAAIMGKAKLHGLAIEKKELSGKAGAPITREVLHKLDDASARRIADLVK